MMKKEYRFFHIPKDVKDLLNKLHTKYEAYLVGGVVRDLLMGMKPKDYDITTNATPDQIKELFKDYTLINNNGEKHGTVTVRYNDENYEITTYRLDSDYTDHRHPDKVEFTTSLEKDLSRRDFTINALVYDGKYVLDYFDGLIDLDHGIIRAVGDPFIRFNEDALRILRMIRFASVLNFRIDTKTLVAAESLKSNLDNIAKERKTAELNKIVCGDGFANLFTNILIYNILKQVLPLTNNHLSNMGQLFDVFNSAVLNSRDYLISYALLFNSLELRKDLSNYLVLSNKDKDMLNDICLVVNDYFHDIGSKFNLLQNTHRDVYEYLITKALHNLKYTDDESYCKDVMYHSLVFSWAVGDLNSHETTYLSSKVDDVIQKGCYSLKQLAINGNDLIKLGLEPGPVIKDLLNGYVNDVIEGKIKNTKKVLIQDLKNKIID